MATVVLHGDLERFGKSHYLDIKTAAEGVHALVCQLDGFKKRLVNGAFFVRVGTKEIRAEEAEKELREPINKDEEIHVVPAIMGAGNAARIIAGVVLIIAGAFTYGQSAAAGVALIASGAALSLSGVASMLTAVAAQNDISAAEKRKNSSFSNIENGVAQGAAIPLVLGEFLVGSKVISQGIESYNVGDSNVDTSYVGTNRSYFTPQAVGGYDIDTSDDSVTSRNYKLR